MKKTRRSIRMIVYKIKITGLGQSPYWGTTKSWARGVGHIPFVGGAGKVWTSKTLAKWILLKITRLTGYDTEYSAEIVEFILVERGI
jgi:hypothetical protein